MAIKTINIIRKDRYNIMQIKYINNLDLSLNIYNLFLSKEETLKKYYPKLELE